MKKLLISALAALLYAVPALHAQDDSRNQADERKEGPTDQAQWDLQVDRWQERMNRMHQQMDQLDRTTDPEKRQKLLEEHWDLMNEQMLSMRMMGGGMMGHMHGGSPRGHDRHMMDQDDGDQYMYDRIDMMHLMMEQMMQHQHMMMRSDMCSR